MQAELQPQSQHCLICSSRNLRRFEAHASDTVEPTRLRINECRDCCFAWQYPIARTEYESVEHFDLNYHAKGKRLSDYFDPIHKREIALLEFGFLSHLPIEGKRLLDIGAGAGVFAEVAAENGWSVTAIDPALDEGHLAGNARVTAIRGTTAALSNDELFDVVTMWDVIEHVMTPVQAILDAAAHLIDGGWLVIETGNYKSAERIDGGNKHWIYQLDHRWYFSPESMAHILEGLGFSDTVYCQKVLRPGWEGGAEYPGPSRAHLLKSIVTDPLNTLPHISRFRGLMEAKNWAMANLGVFAIACKKRAVSSVAPQS